MTLNAIEVLILSTPLVAYMLFKIIANIVWLYKIYKRER